MTMFKLAQYHLSIMSFRLEKNFHLKVVGDIENDWLPPGIIHTLVENGVSHNKYRIEDIEFVLERYINDQDVVFSLSVPQGKKRRNTSSEIGTGTGSKYISAQLEQAFSRHYKITNKETDSYWTTKISISLKQYKKTLESVELR